ncbi:MAG TPA: beta-ketoacyl synthase chain length factor [Ramlibacter sp.]|jgi:hypothetical protein
MTSLSFRLHAAGVLAPGLPSLPELRAVSSGAAPYTPAPLKLPSPALLPAHERRRASQPVRLVLACIEQALETCPFPVRDMRSVFATDEGTGEVCQQMLDTLATTRQVSPLLFPNSVLNAPSGYFSIAWRNQQPATVVSLGLESFASGLLCAVTEAQSTAQPVLLVVYDPAMTSPLSELLPVQEATASAWIISSGPVDESVPVLCAFSIAMEPAGTQSATPLPAWLPASWVAHSSARGLAALGLLEAEAGTPCRLSLGGQILTLQRTQEGRA